MAVPAAVGIAQKAMAYASQYAPAAINAAQAYVAKSGKDLSSLAGRTSDANAQGAVITALARGGMDVERFTQTSELTDAERKRYEGVFRKIRGLARQKSDERAIGVGAQFSERMAFFADIQEAETVANMSATQLYRLKLVLDRLTEETVDEYTAQRSRGVRFR